MENKIRILKNSLKKLRLKRVNKRDTNTIDELFINKLFNKLLILHKGELMNSHVRNKIQFLTLAKEGNQIRMRKGVSTSDCKLGVFMETFKNLDTLFTKNIAMLTIRSTVLMAKATTLCAIISNFIIATLGKISLEKVQIIFTSLGSIFQVDGNHIVAVLVSLNIAH